MSTEAFQYSRFLLYLLRDFTGNYFAVTADLVPTVVTSNYLHLL